MFIGHYAVAFAAKKVAPKTSLGTLFFAVSFLDLLFAVLLLTGWEEADIIYGTNEYMPLYLSKFPYSHSLLACAGWTALISAVYWRLTQYRTGTIWVGLCIASHWILDFVAHRPDLQLTPGNPALYGLGLWNSRLTTFLLEGTMFLVGLGLYLSVTQRKSTEALISLWSLVLFLSFFYGMTFFAPPPPSIRAIAFVNLSAWLIPLWGVWIERTSSFTRLSGPSNRVISS